MNKESIKNQTIRQDCESFFRNTFKEAISMFSESNVYFCGRKMYIRANHCLVSAEFAGTEQAFSSVVLTAMNANGILDQNITPLKMIFKESKIFSGQDKIVNMKCVYGETGIYSMIWSTDLTPDDYSKLNEFLITYAEMFSAL